MTIYVDGAVTVRATSTNGALITYGEHSVWMPATTASALALDLQRAVALLDGLASLAAASREYP